MKNSALAVLWWYGVWYSSLMEQIHHDKRDGRLCNHDLAEYQCVNADVPDLGNNVTRTGPMPIRYSKA